jgi:hypothetical protein
MDKIITQMEVQTGGWKLMLNRQRTQAPQHELWSVIRYPVDKPMIPPYGAMLTTNGWEPVLREHLGSTLYVTEQRLASIIEETCA